MTEPTYTQRIVEWGTVQSIDEHGAVTGSHGWTCLPPKDVVAQLAVGDEYGVEMRPGIGGTISGFHAHGRWLSRKSDQQLEQERRDLLERMDRERRDRLAEHRSEWVARDEALPGWLHDRMEVFHRRGGENFRREGWGYELCIAELAAMYAANGCEDTDDVNAYAEQHGTSGNQHGCARSLARAHLDGQSIANTVGGLSPITGDAFYESATC